MLEEHGKYETFCRETAGSFIEHLPGDGEGNITWIDAYEAKFGRLDPLWFTDEDGNLDHVAYEKYLRARGFEASWKCTPGAPARKAVEEIRASWKCTPGTPARKAVEEIRASWKCTPGAPARKAVEEAITL